MAYNKRFIPGYSIGLPTLPRSRQKEAAPLRHGRSPVIHYRHHSILMNKSRRFAFFSASNIDGRDWRNLNRKGSFRKDSRSIAPEYQLGNELYNAIRTGTGRPNDFEQGHLTSFQEVIWGRRPEDRKAAANDTFYFTNCVPQHERVNAGLWRSLEQYILKTQTVHNHLRVSVLTGPLLSAKDPYYIEKINGELIQIPCVFWKVVYYANSRGLNAVGFMMSQAELLLKEGTVTYRKSAVRELAADTGDEYFMDFKYDSVYQVRVEFIQQKTGLDFMLKGVHLPYQSRTKKNILYRRIEVPPSARGILQGSRRPIDFKLSGLTL